MTLKSTRYYLGRSGLRVMRLSPEIGQYLVFISFSNVSFTIEKKNLSDKRLGSDLGIRASHAFIPSGTPTIIKL